MSFPAEGTIESTFLHTRDDDDIDASVYDTEITTIAGTKYVVAEGSTTTIADILEADDFCGFFALNDKNGDLIEHVKFA